jgi:hypothetical protein
MKFPCLLIVPVIALMSLAFPSCTDTGAIDWKNPVVQQAASDAERIALDELTAALDRQVRAKSIAREDVTMKDPVVVGAMTRAEVKIKRKHPGMPDAQIKIIVATAAKKKIKRFDE